LLRNKLLLLILIIAGSGGWYYHSLPGHLQENESVRQRLILKDRNGLDIRAYTQGETYDWMTLSEVPPELVLMIVLAEDKNFYTHKGLDVGSTLRSVYQNLKSFSVVSGASTISQQVYRQGFSINRGFIGKVKTILGALKIERNYPKEKILETYLNTLPYAYRLVGVKRAGEVFFGKEISLLSLGEMATLAVLPRSPSGLRTRKDDLIRTRNLILDQYAKLSKTDPLEIDFAKKLPVEFMHDTSGWDNYHYAEGIKQNSEFPKYISRYGRIDTTLDLYLQKESHEILKTHLSSLKKFDVHHGALVVLNNNNGDVLAYVGSHDIKEQGGQYDALKILRQPGSALKPLTYALSLMKGKKLSDVLPDIPSYYKTGLGQFLPRNYDQNYSGPRLMREALANSLNLPAVALADEIGVTELYEFFKGMGLTLLKDASHYGVGMTLGNVEIAPLELAQVYTAFANRGTAVRPRFFRDEPVKTYATPLTSEAAYLISDVLSDKVARREEFGESNPFDLPFSLSVKTGTSTDFRDNWVVGYNHDYTIVVWVGNTDQKPMKRVSGITGAGPVMRDVARFLAKRSLMKPIAKLENIESAAVCSLSGKLPGKFCAHRKNELFITGTKPTETCEWHQEISVKECSSVGMDKSITIAVLPDAYQSWIKDRPEWSIEHQVNEQCQNPEKTYAPLISLNETDTTITKPLSGSIYAIDPNIPRSNQKLKIEIGRYHHVKMVKWKMDGKDLESKTPAIDWPMEKGLHKIEAEVEFDNGKRVQTPQVEVRIL
jgi:penicillin-binding protein 1C